MHSKILTTWRESYSSHVAAFMMYSGSPAPWYDFASCHLAAFLVHAGIVATWNEFPRPDWNKAATVISIARRQPCRCAAALMAPPFPPA